MRIDYKGISIFYECYGKGETVVLLHGFLENSSMWNAILPELISGHQVVTIDLLGHGETGCLGYVHTMEMMADAVNAVLNILNVTSCFLIGHSMGGYVALALAKMKTLTIMGICLMNSTYQEDSKERKQIRQRAIKMAKTNYKVLVQISFVNLFSAESKVAYEEEMSLALDEALKTPVQGYIAAQDGMCKRHGALSFLKSFKGKVLLIIGTEDAIVDAPSIIEEVKRTSLNYVKIRGGHMSHIENKKELTYVLNQFIEK